MVRRLKRNFKKLAGRKSHFSKGPADLVEKFSLNWSRTQAIVPITAQHAFLFLNLKGRQKGGTVEAGEQYQQLIEELKTRFLAVSDPETDTQIFADAKTPQELYNLSEPDPATFGDLVLIPTDGYLPIRSLRGSSFIRRAHDHNLGGCHRYEGMYLLHGRDIKSGTCIDAHIADIAPTIYAALGVPLPAGLDGAVIQDAFEKPLETSIADSADESLSIPPQSSPALSPEEEQQITQRLADLGYLE